MNRHSKAARTAPTDAKGNRHPCPEDKAPGLNARDMQRMVLKKPESA